jgi:hypothetical protein
VILAKYKYAQENYQCRCTYAPSFHALPLA